MQRICSTLAENGYEVCLIGRQKKTSIPLQKTVFQTIRLNCFFEKGKFFYAEYNLRLLFFLLFSRFEAVCAIDLDTIVPAVLAGKLKGKKIVYDAHEYFTEVEEVVGRPAIQKMWRWIERQTVPRVDAAYTVSESLAQLFTQQYNKPFGLVRNVSMFKPSHHEPNSQSYLIYIGAVNAGRGLEQLIEAMQFIDNQLYICGDGDILETLKALAATLNVSHKIKFWGYVQPAQLHELTANASIGYLLLDNKSLSYYYSLANKFFDYIHAEIPQITANFPEYQLLNKIYGVAILVDLTVAEIVEATNKLLLDTAYYQQIANNTRRARQELSWQQESQKLLAIYQQLLMDK